MGLRINTNVLSLNAQRNLGINSRAFARALQRLSSGSRINRAGDDAAGLAISEGLGAQVRGTAQAVRNANEAIGFLNTAEGALAELTNITQRLRELGIQAANGTLSSLERGYLDSEKEQLISEFDRIATQTQFNGAFLLDGSFTTTDLQVGVQKGMTISFNIGNARASSLGGLATLSGLRSMIQTALSGMIINGIAINNSTSTDDAISSANNSFSAIAIAKRINEVSGQTKVYADVQDTIVKVNTMDFTNFNGDLSGDNFKINNVSILGTGVNNINSFISAVNNYSGSTGVKARLQASSTNSIEFYAEDGRNIQLFWSATLSSGIYNAFANSTNFVAFSSGTVFTYLLSATTGISTALGSTGAVRTGAIKLRSSSAITIANMQSAALGFGNATTSYNITVDASAGLAAISLSDQDRASDALSVIDATLTSLNTLRSGLGATQSRLDSVIQNLGVTLENISGARSQIRDTDVAVETAELTRAQVLQQAGVAVLGQANASSQSALQLLQNL